MTSLAPAENRNRGISALQLEEIWNEIRAHWLLLPSDDGEKRSDAATKDVAMRLLQGLRLESLTIDHQMQFEDEDNMIRSAETLKLEFTMPEAYYCGTKEKPKRRKYEWEVCWYDANSLRPLLCGRLSCPPFVEDPPLSNALQRGLQRENMISDEALRQTFLDKFNNQAHKFRPHWDLKVVKGSGVRCRDKCQNWLRAAPGCKLKSLDWKDVARIVVPAVGILARDHPANPRGIWILKRLMLSLERELRSWSESRATTKVYSDELLRRRWLGSGTRDDENKNVDDDPRLRQVLLVESRWDKK